MGWLIPVGRQCVAVVVFSLQSEAQQGFPYDNNRQKVADLGILAELGKSTACLCWAPRRGWNIY
jgi:hypothetical protein